MEELKVFGGAAIREAVAIIDHLEKQGKTIACLRRYVGETREEHSKAITRSDQVAKTAPRKKTTVIKAQRNTRSKRCEIPLLKPGETEEMAGVVCDKCHKMVYIEGVCAGNKIVRKGFTRRGLCGSCGSEFLIR